MVRKKKTGRTAISKKGTAIIAASALIATAVLGIKLFGKKVGASEKSENKAELYLELADVDEDVDMELLLELIGVEGPSTAQIRLDGGEPSVLIYHTHTKEGYFPSADYDYEPESGWRNHDDSMNVVAVGERLADILREDYGINVIHDTTNHEPPKLSTAYSRSLETMEYYKGKYPSIELFIDLHRDAYGEPEEPTDYISVNGKECARIMFVVGTGKGATGTGFDEMPDFNSNYALALELSEYLKSVNEELVKNIRVKAGRYNQHVSSACLLAEIGHNGNTFEQALNAVGYLAEAIGRSRGTNVSADTEKVDALPLVP